MCRYVRLQNRTANTWISGNYVKLYLPQGNVIYNSAAIGASLDAGGNIWQTDGTDLAVLTGVTATTEAGQSESSGGFVPGSLTDGNLSEANGWRTEYISNPPHFPYTLNLAFGSTSVYGLTYYPLSAARNGVESPNEGDITKFAVYSRSGSTRTWLIGGDWPADGQPHTVYFRPTTATSLEFEVIGAEGRFGGASEFQVLRAAAPAGSAAPIVEEANYAPKYAFDDRMDTAWSTRGGTAVALDIDLGVSRTIDYGRIYFGSQIPASYTVQYQNESGSWVNFAAVSSGNTDASPWLLSSAAVTARYWRFTTPAYTAGVTVRSFELYARDLPEALSISNSELNLSIGDSALLTATIAPVTARDHTVTWSSSDSSIVGVNQATGKITAYGGGDAVITATSRANAALTKTCLVHVTAVPVAGVLLDKTGTLYVGVGETCQLTPTILPSNASFSTINWVSGNENAVSVSHNGFVKGVAVGASVVTASCGGQTAALNVVVVDISEIIAIDNTAGEIKVRFSSAVPSNLLKMLFTATYDDGYGVKTMSLLNMASSEGTVTFSYAPFPPNKQGRVLTTLKYKDGKAAAKTIPVEQGLTVTFSSPGADVFAVPSSIIVTGAMKTVGTLPAPPTRAHCTFIGWYTEPDGKGTPFLDSTPVTDDITVYAAWDYELFPVTFETYGGTEIAPIQGAYTKTIEAPADPVKAGNVFRGWFKDAAFTLPWNFSSDIITGPVTLYAKFVEPATNPLFYYPFDDASELARTGAYGINSISTNNRPVVEESAGLGGALRFPGNNGYVRIDANSFRYRVSSVTQAFSVSMWINPTATNRDQYLFTCDQGDAWLLLRNGGYLGTYGMGGGNTTLSHTPIKANEWTHVAVSVDASLVKFYINGVLAGQHASTGTWYGTGSAGFFGLGGKSNSTTSTACFTGYMDEVRFFGSALTAAQAEILALTKQELLVAVAKFESLVQADWTRASWGVAKAAYDVAVGLLAAEFPTQVDVDAAVADLLVAIDGLELAITFIRINAAAIVSVKRGDSLQFSVSIDDGAFDGRIVWEVSNPLYATVGENGCVTILNKTGTVILAATDPDTGFSHSIVLRIT
jgi:uncharacterized repeat protein (TIGR02543 family)